MKTTTTLPDEAIEFLFDVKYCILNNEVSDVILSKDVDMITYIKKTGESRDIKLSSDDIRKIMIQINSIL